MTQTRSDSDSDGRAATDQERSTETAQREEPAEPTAWFASAAVRAGLTVVGIVLLLFALGQAVGLPLLELTTEALTSETGRWLVVAFFAILLIAAAQRAAPIR